MYNIYSIEIININNKNNYKSKNNYILKFNLLNEKERNVFISFMNKNFVLMLRKFIY